MCLVQRERDVEALAKKESVSGFQIQGVRMCSALCVDVSHDMCCLFTLSQRSPEDVIGNEMQHERLLAFQDCFAGEAPKETTFLRLSG
ncbi:hypothetical protein DPMN_057916 [Dreissena polymorpha]|uniref:Uncharacterized protein n=1 Tax=Dreissena polymorpha TaxID=45954 RepID=A0A9D4C119_DREPO|nr:hypothetical protein DPMN_057916 [Dreissena polymorpha]